MATYVSKLAEVHPRAVLGMVLFGALAFVALLYFIGKGDTGPGPDNGQAHALSHGLTGYAGLAGKSSIFSTTGPKAVEPANTGYIAICSALGFLPGKPGETWSGSGDITLAEAADALYKALEYIR